MRAEITHVNMTRNWVLSSNLQSVMSSALTSLSSVFSSRKCAAFFRRLLVSFNWIKKSSVQCLDDQELLASWKASAKMTILEARPRAAAPEPPRPEPAQHCVHPWLRIPLKPHRPVSRPTLILNCTMPSQLLFHCFWLSYAHYYTLPSAKYGDEIPRVIYCERCFNQ